MKGALCDPKLEVLGDLVLVGDAADALADLPGGCVSERAAGPVDHLADLVELALGRAQQLLALPCALGGQVWVAAEDQSLAGELLRGDLGEVSLIEQR